MAPVADVAGRSGNDRLVRDLAGRLGSLGVEVADIAGHLEDLSTRVSGQAAQFEELHQSTETMAAGNREIDAIARSAAGNLEACDATLAELGGLAEGVQLSSTSLAQADKRVEGLLGLSEGLIELIAGSGVETSDTPIIRLGVDTARRIGELFESAIARGEITEAQLFDERYREIRGSNPKQYLTDYVEFTDRVLPAIQDPLQRSDPRIIFCVAWAKGGYLPTHNPNYRQPQGKDPVWNAAHCRNRRLFKDRAVQKVARNNKPFLLQTYRRDMGGGNFVLLKDLSAPIWVRSRHWGAFRIGYRQQ